MLVYVCVGSRSSIMRRLILMMRSLRTVHKRVLGLFKADDLQNDCLHAYPLFLLLYKALCAVEPKATSFCHMRTDIE